MQVYLDDNPYPLEASEAVTVGQVLDDVLKTVHADGKVVTAIRCDAEELGAETLNEALAKGVDSYDRLDFESGMAGQLTIEALSHVQAMLMDLEPTKEQAIERLNQGQIAEAMDALKTYFGAWHQAHEAVLQGVRLVKLDISELAVDDLPVSEMFDKFADQLRDLKEALEARDHVTLADILNYEAQETTQRWVKLIDQIKDASKDR